MGDEKKCKTKMVQVSIPVYKKLLVRKHKLEDESESSWSFSSVIDWLLENQRNV